MKIWEISINTNFSNGLSTLITYKSTHKLGDFNLIISLNRIDALKILHSKAAVYSSTEYN